MNVFRIAALQAFLCIVILSCSRAPRESVRKSADTNILVSSGADGALEGIVQALRAAPNLGTIGANEIEGVAANLRLSRKRKDEENASLLREAGMNSFAVSIGIEDRDYKELAGLLATNAYVKEPITGVGFCSRGNTNTAVIKLVLTFDGNSGKFIYFGRQGSEPWRVLTSVRFVK